MKLTERRSNGRWRSCHPCFGRRSSCVLRVTECPTRRWRELLGASVSAIKMRALRARAKALSSALGPEQCDGRHRLNRLMSRAALSAGSGSSAVFEEE